MDIVKQDDVTVAAKYTASLKEAEDYLEKKYTEIYSIKNFIICVLLLAVILPFVVFPLVGLTQPGTITYQCVYSVMGMYGIYTASIINRKYFYKHMALTYLASYNMLLKDIKEIEESEDNNSIFDE